MEGPKPPQISTSMGEEPDESAVMPNRQTRRIYKKLKGTPKLAKLVAEQSPQPEEPTVAPDDTPTDSQAELLKHVDVQRILGILGDLLNGTKRLVIESKPTRQIERVRGGSPMANGLVDYKHTFKVEDSDGAK
jgi:hypothetical protein